MLTIDSISKQYSKREGNVAAVRGVSLELKKGDFVAVRGPSGCGKSTLLLAAGGLLQPDNGRVMVQNQNLYTLSSDQRAIFRAEHIGFVFQQFHLIPYFTVFENILSPEAALITPNANKRARDLMEKFQLTSRQHHYPSELSTGEQQRTALARALLNNPEIILADEPTGNLDEANAEVVFGFFKEFSRSGGAVLLVTHDARAAAHVQRTITMKDGVISHGHPTNSDAKSRPLQG
jgi:putative ABC transport system ATP-binding protein